MLLLGKVQQTVQCAAWLTEVANREGLHGVRVGVTTGAMEHFILVWLLLFFNNLLSFNVVVVLFYF